MKNPLASLFSKVSSMTGTSEPSAVGVDIGTSAIKVVEIKRKGGRAILETYGAVALGPYDSQSAGMVTNLKIEQQVEALKEVMKESGITSTVGAFSLPVQSNLIFTIELPIHVKESEVAAIVPTEARKYIPVPMTEVTLDYFTLPKKEPSLEEMSEDLSDPNKDEKLKDKTSVLVVATQNDAVAKYRSIISQSSINASFFEVEIFSSVRANLEHELSPVLLVDFGASRTKLSIIEFGVVKSYHSINRGGADITTSISKSLSIPFGDAEKMKKEFGLLGGETEKSLTDIIKIHTDYIFSETNNVLLSYEKKYGRTITKLIFTGGGALMKGIAESAANNFRAEIEIGHPFSKVNAPEFLKKVLETLGPEFAVALGLALRKLQ